MSIKKLAAYMCVLVCGIAIGYWLAPSFEREAPIVDAPVETPAIATEQPAPAPVRVVPPGARLERRREFARVDLTEPDLHARIRPVLNRGTNVEIAASEFRTAADFAAVAHASRSTGIPFMVLKHQVVNEGKSLEAAIREAKPNANADIEADLALAKAHADLAAVARE